MSEVVAMYRCNRSGWASAVCVIWFTDLAFSADRLEEIARLPSASVPAAIGTELLNNAASTMDFTFDIDLKCSDKGVKPPLPAEAIAVKTAFQNRLVTSRHFGYYEDTGGPYLSISTYSENENRHYSYDGARLKNVERDCRLPNVLPEFVFFCQITGASGWLQKDEVCDTKTWVDGKIKSMTFDGLTMNELGKVIVLDHKLEKNPRFSMEGGQKHFFGEFQNKIVWKGNESITKVIDATGHSRSYMRTSKVYVDYQSIDGQVIPSRLSVKTITSDLDSKGGLISDPTLAIDKTITITRCKVLQSFPQKLISINIPKGVAIYDNCKPEPESELPVENDGMFQKVVLGLGSLFCVVSLGLWLRRRFKS